MPEALSKRSHVNEGGATDALAVTPNDSTDLSQAARALYIGGAGNVVVDTLDGTTITFSGATAGSVIPCAVKRVRSTSTTATNIVALL